MAFRKNFIAAIVVVSTILLLRLFQGQPPELEEYLDATQKDSTELVAEPDRTSALDPSWQPLQQALCGKGYPNMEITPALFQLARREVFGVVNRNSTSLQPHLVERIVELDEHSEPTKFLNYFFDGDYGALLYHDPNNSKFTTIYVRILKGGSEQIRDMMGLLGTHQWKNHAKLFMQLKEVIGLLYNTPYTQKNSTGRQYKYKFQGRPFIYTVLRDPVSHFLSGFNEAQHRLINHLHCLSTAQRPQEKFYDIDYDAASIEMFNDQQKQDRFKTFVKDLLLEEPAFFKSKVYQHFFTMSKIVGSLHRYNLKHLQVISHLLQT
ncbi:MAG: hypothetical protein SGILL_009077 [Bacillariaceae sp.]